MIRLWDGFLSFLCALLTLAILGLPGWGAYLALRAGLMPGWGWAPLAALGFVAVVMIFAFLKKTWRGVHPLRERRR